MTFLYGEYSISSVGHIFKLDYVSITQIGKHLLKIGFIFICIVSLSIYLKRTSFAF